MRYYCKTCKRIVDENRYADVNITPDGEHECGYCGSTNLVEARYCPICNEVIANDDDSYCSGCIVDFRDYIIVPIEEMILGHGSVYEAKEVIAFIMTSGETKPSDEDKCPICATSVNDDGIFCVECQKEIDCIVKDAESVMYCDFEALKVMVCEICQL